MSQIVYLVTTTWTRTPSGERQFVVWDAGLIVPYSTTTWDNGTTIWIH